MNTIIHGDCLEALTQLDDDVFDLILIDPPYFDYITQHRKEGRKHKFGHSMAQQSKEDQLRVIQECIRVLKNNSAFFLFSNWENMGWMQERFSSHFHNKIIWNKKNWTAGNLKGSFGNIYEEIFLGVKGKWKYRGKRDNDIWEISRAGIHTRIHATEKPVELYEKIISISTDEGAMILDPYLGSGASAVAALNLNRNLLGYEIDDEYYQGILNRLKNIKDNIRG